MLGKKPKLEKNLFIFETKKPIDPSLFDLFNLYYLLPQKPDTIIASPIILKHYLRTYQFIIDLCIESINLFHENSYYKFDPQIGDTLCQIRAIKLLLLSKNIFFLESIKTNLIDLKKIKEKINFLINNNLREEFNKNLTLEQYLNLKKINLIVSKNFIFLVQSFFLTKYSIRNQDGIPISMNQTKLQNDLCCSRRYAKFLIHFSQKNIADWSCELIYKIFNKIDKDLTRANILSQLEKISDEGKKVLPCLDVTRTIIKYLLKLNYPIALAVNISSTNKLFYFLCKKINNNYSISKGDVKLEKPIMIFRGFTNLKLTQIEIARHFNELGICEILLSNSMQHPQYSGKALKTFNENVYLPLFKIKLVFLIVFFSFPFTLFSCNLKSLNNELSCLISLIENSLNLEKISIIYGCGNKNTLYFNLTHIYFNKLSSELSLNSNSCIFNVLDDNISYPI